MIRTSFLFPLSNALVYGLRWRIESGLLRNKCAYINAEEPTQVKYPIQGKELEYEGRRQTTAPPNPEIDL